MNILISMALGLFALSASAQNIKLPDYNWTMTDIASRGYNKDDLYESMDTTFVRPRSSICSNRALMWSQNFKQVNKLDTGKVFLFYTKKKSRVGSKTWWYHVAPIVNEKGEIWAMDPGFPGFIDGPLNIQDWLETFTESKNCKQIRARDIDLVERMFITQVFPQSTRHGYHDCYYILTPHTLWTPETVAMSILGKDSEGKVVNFSRPTIDREEYYQACIEATTGKLSFAFGGNREKCKQLSDRINW
jgi:hypothetical protein